MLIHTHTHTRRVRNRVLNDCGTHLSHDSHIQLSPSSKTRVANIRKINASQQLPATICSIFCVFFLFCFMIFSLDFLCTFLVCVFFFVGFCSWWKNHKNNFHGFDRTNERNVFFFYFRWSQLCDRYGGSLVNSCDCTPQSISDWMVRVNGTAIFFLGQLENDDWWILLPFMYILEVFVRIFFRNFMTFFSSTWRGKRFDRWPRVRFRNPDHARMYRCCFYWNISVTHGFYCLCAKLRYDTQNQTRILPFGFIFAYNLSIHAHYSNFNWPTD